MSDDCGAPIVTRPDGTLERRTVKDAESTWDEIHCADVRVHEICRGPSECFVSRTTECEEIESCTFHNCKYKVVKETTTNKMTPEMEAVFRRCAMLKSKLPQ
jgi:hypothetical protein